VIDATADFLIATSRLFFIQLFYFLVSVIVVTIWAFGLYGVVSLNEVIADHNLKGGR
jgi:hypothetical protein